MADKFPIWVKARVNVRRGEGWNVKPGGENVDGKTFRFTFGWIMDESDTSIYVGEAAYSFHHDNRPVGEDAPVWIASGDLDVILVIPAEEFFAKPKAGIKIPM